MTSMECFDCGCHNSARWVCLDCNNKLIISPTKNDKLEVQDLKQLKDLSSIKKTYILSTSEKESLQQEQQQPFSNQNILCQQHRQPITFYHQQKHQLFCALCLFDSSLTRTIIKPYGLIPIKSSSQLVFKQFKNTILQITQLSKNLDDDLKKSITYQRSIQRHRKYLQIVLSQSLNEMVQLIKMKQQQIKKSIESKLSQQLQIYELHENHLTQLKNNIKEIKLLGNKKRSEKVQQLVSLFEAAKTIRRSLKQDIYKVDSFNSEQFEIKGLPGQKEDFQKVINRIFSWVAKKDTRSKTSSQINLKREKQKGILNGYLQKSRKAFK